MNDNLYLNTLKQKKSMILNTVGICCALSLASFFVLPKNFKVSTTLALQTEYFQLPLVSGFLPETHDPQELKSKREALMHLALNQKFLTELADRYKLVKDPADSKEIEELYKKFQIVPSGGSAFTVSFNGKNAEVTYKVMQDFLAHLKSVMTDERRTLLLNLHDAIQEQLETLSVGKQGETASTILASRPDLVKRQIAKIQNQVDTLKRSYSERHPRVLALNQQLAELSRYNSNVYADNTLPSMSAADIFTGAQVDPASKELFDDLLKKYRYLEVVIYMDQQNKDQYLSYLNEPFMPHTATFPKLPLLLAWGLALGFMIGSIRALIDVLPGRLSKRLAAIAQAARVRTGEELS